MVDGSQLLEGGRRPLHEARRSERAAGDVKEKWRVVGETARDGDLYTSRTRRMGRCEAPSPKGPRQTRWGSALPGSREGRPFHHDVFYLINSYSITASY